MLARVLTLALLFAQAGAVVHAYSHLSDDPGERQGIARGCGYCIASSQLQHAAGPPAVAVPAPVPAFATVVVAPAPAAIPARPFRAFRSRAPPALV